MKGFLLLAACLALEAAFLLHAALPVGTRALAPAAARPWPALPAAAAPCEVTPQERPGAASSRGFDQDRSRRLRAPMARRSTRNSSAAATASVSAS